MSKYDDLFDDTRADESVFVDKSALGPLAEPDEIVAREAQAARSKLAGGADGQRDD